MNLFILIVMIIYVKITPIPENKKIIDEAENLLKMTVEEDKYFLYGTVGNLYRICEDTQKEINYLNFCLKYVLVDGDIKKEVVTLI